MTSRSESAPGSRPRRHNWALAQGPIHALGESKNLGTWAQDPRCRVSKATLRGRLALGWEAEDAITRGTGEEPPLRFAHFGRALSLRGWAEQSGIGYQTLYTRVFTDGTRFRDALLQGPDDPGYGVPVTAFGETKPLHLWALDPRANCTAARLHWRVNAGWPPELAITAKPQSPQEPKTRPVAARQAPESVTLDVTADHLQPGDSVLAVGQDPASGTPVLNVRRPSSPPAPAMRKPSVPATPTEAQTAAPPPAPATPQDGAPRR
ncbi:hypothetical protein [Streptomyces sp. AK02-01A]|uniref:hypothetical protein n=1 Tax=Streptomyces sp. AK02-01A TaxID=3028648 RepID=UPI0029B85794|nr:hypothetical protein [Streptomyces sp. AK02-01A]MDX3855900.1 hypothetical protein [Streptomyces sp. AK02-01A]